MRIEITEQGRKNLEQTFQRHIDAFKDLEVWAFPRAFPVFARAIQKNFAQEGAFFGQRWAPLAPLTQRNRRLLGYKPQGPILRRSGSLMRSLIEPEMGTMNQSMPDPSAPWWEPTPSVRIGNQVRTRRNFGYTETEFVVYDERFALLNDGGIVDGRTIPARPMLPGSRDQEWIQRRAEKSIGALLGELLQEPDWHIGTDRTYEDQLYWEGRYLEPTPNRGFQV
jgi:hypothetical protein